MLLKRNRKQAIFPPPEEGYIIEDDNKTVPHLPMKELCTLSKDKEESDSIPSFDLLDEDFEEGGRAPDVEEDKCKIITEKTVFDHIREKAKNFSLLSASDNIRCPPLEVLLARTHAREKRPDRCHEVVVLDDEDELQVPQQKEANLPAELRKAEQDDINLDLTLDDHVTAGSSNYVSSILDTDVFLPEPEARSHQKSAEETVFYHIRRKSEDFPLISKLDCREPAIRETELFSKNNPRSPSSLTAACEVSRETNSLDMVTGNMLSSYLETAEVEKYSSNIQVATEVKSKEVEAFNSIDGGLNISKGTSRADSVQSSIYVPTVSFSMWKEKKRSSGPVSFEESSKKQCCSSRETKEEKYSSTEIRRQFCSSEITGQGKEIESYLGFKSVFSFL